MSSTIRLCASIASAFPMSSRLMPAKLPKFLLLGQHLGIERLELGGQCRPAIPNLLRTDQLEGRILCEPLRPELSRSGARNLELAPLAQFDGRVSRVWEQFLIARERVGRTGLDAAAVMRIHVYIRKTGDDLCRTWGDVASDQHRTTDDWTTCTQTPLRLAFVSDCEPR